MKAVQCRASQTPTALLTRGENPVGDGGPVPAARAGAAGGQCTLPARPRRFRGRRFHPNSRFLLQRSAASSAPESRSGRRWRRMPLGSGHGGDADSSSSVAGEMHDTHGASTTATHRLRRSPACGRHRPCHPAADDAGARAAGWGEGDAPGPAAVLGATPPSWEQPPPPLCSQGTTKGDLLCKATPKASPWESRLTLLLTPRKKVALDSNSEPRVLDRYDDFKAAAWTSGNTFGFVHIYVIKNTLKPSWL